MPVTYNSLNHFAFDGSKQVQISENGFSGSFLAAGPSQIEDYTSLQKLAGVNKLEDEYNALTSNINNPLIAEEIKRQKAEAAQAATRAAAASVIRTLENAEKQIDILRKNLASVRRAETSLKDTIRAIAVYTEYGNATSDYTYLYSAISGIGFDIKKMDQVALKAAEAAVAAKLKEQQPAVKKTYKKSFSK